MLAFVVPAGDYEKEAALLTELESRGEIDHAVGLANTEAMDDYMLADKLTPRQFSELAGLDYEMAQVVYAAEPGRLRQAHGKHRLVQGAAHRHGPLRLRAGGCGHHPARCRADEHALGRGTIISMLFVLFVLPQILLLGGGLADKTSISMPTAARTHQSRERVFVVGLVTGEISGTVSGLVRASVDGNVNLRVISGRIADGAQPENPRLEEGSHEEE